MDTNDVILEELRAIRETLDDLASDSKQRITKLETETKPLFDNGQPGKLSQIDVRVKRLENWRIYIIGFGAGVAALVSLIVGLVVKAFSTK
jgi:hypothetical protein